MKKTYLRQHWKKVSLISFLFVAFLGRFEVKMPKRNFADFHVNYYTGQRMLNHQNVYDLDGYRKDGMANFKYPPLFAAITALFALTSERAAATIWFAAGFILLIIFMHFSGRLIFTNNLTYKQKNWIYFWSLFLTSRFHMQNFDEGQVNFLMMTTLLLGLYTLTRKKELLAALLFGFSILIKYMSAIFIPYFLFKKKFRLVFYIFCSMAFFTFLPALVWGWGHNLFLQKQFFPYVCSTSLDMFSLSDYANQSLFSAIVRLFSDFGSYGINIFALSDKGLFLVLFTVPILLYLVILLPSKSSKSFFNCKEFDSIDIGLILVCAALLNPNAWKHAFIFMTFGYMVALSYLIQTKTKDKIVLFLVFLSFLLHSFPNSFLTESWAGETFDILSFVTLGALVLFVGLSKIKFFPSKIVSYDG